MSLPSERLPGPDVTRALALIGVVVMNYHGYLNGGAAAANSESSFAQRLFDPWTGVLSTRFAATFVLVAGIGVTLLTNRSRLSRDPGAIRADRWRLVRRGFFLYAVGFVLDWIWGGTILFFYGAFFIIAALLFTLRSRWLIVVGSAAALIAAALEWWRVESSLDGDSLNWLFSPATLETRSPRGLLLDTFVNGTHPLFPWLAYLCLGIVVGRLLPALPRARLLAIGVAATVGTYLVNHLVGFSDVGPVRRAVLSTRPFDRGLLYTLGTAGTSLVAFCVISWLADRYRDAAAVRALLATGRTTLSLYLLHVLVFRFVVDVQEWVRPTGLDTALLLAGSFWVVAVLLAWAWNELVGMGPAERLYRAFGG
jgi:uncharacterized membrane protein YeiB